jgi:hypothetical protein
VESLFDVVTTIWKYGKKNAEAAYSKVLNGQKSNMKVWSKNPLKLENCRHHAEEEKNILTLEILKYILLSIVLLQSKGRP